MLLTAEPSLQSQIYFILNCMHECMSVYLYKRGLEASYFPGEVGVKGGCELAGVSPLQDQQVLLTINPSLHPKESIFFKD